MKFKELKIKNPDKIYQELANSLAPYRGEPAGSFLFIVEGTKKKPVIGIKYPGRKVRKREELRTLRQNSALWANLYDFEVVPFKNGKELQTKKFTFENLLRDFQEHKRDNKKFRKLVEFLYYKNSISQKPPKLPGIESKLFLSVLKWIWIQEDFNYRFNWQEVESPIRYVLETRTGTRISKGAGRAKFFAALILFREHFDFDQVKKIIPFY